MRSRNIKPALFKNELLGTADPLLTILFAGLWCLADREGRLEDRPLRIAAEIFPYRTVGLPDINGYLTELSRLDFISRYEVNGVKVIRIKNFHRHQSPHSTEKPSELPPEPADNKGDAGLTVTSPLNNESLTVKEPLDNALIPDSLNSDSLNTEARDGTVFPYRPSSSRERIFASAAPVNPAAHATLESWLDALAPVIGAKSKHNIFDPKGWEIACAKAIGDGRTLDDFLTAAKDELERTRDCPQFFSSTGVLKRLQTQAAKPAVKKFIH